VLRYEDFVDGDRLKRVYAALRPGSSALTAVLFFDSINRDKKGDTYIFISCFCFDTIFELCFDDDCFNVCFDVCFDVLLDVCFDVLLDVCFDVLLDVCFDVLLDVMF